MTDVFLSYAHDDLARDERPRVLHKLMIDQGWSVFWDRTIRVGEDWRAKIDAGLAGARSVLVLWDEHSVASREVQHEAAIARASSRLLQARMRDVAVPAPYTGDQWARLEKWDGARRHPELANLFSAVEGMVLPRSEAVTLPDPGDGAITSRHIQLVHSCQRRSDLDTASGQRMYRIQVMLIGHQSALDRLTGVNYLLDGAYKGRTARRSESRLGNFGFSELANGYSVVNATVEIGGQDGRVELSRFINLMEQGPDLVSQFAPEFRPPRRGS